MWKRKETIATGSLAYRTAARSGKPHRSAVPACSKLAPHLPGAAQESAHAEIGSSRTFFSARQHADACGCCWLACRRTRRGATDTSDSNTVASVSGACPQLRLMDTIISRIGRMRPAPAEAKRVQVRAHAWAEVAFGERTKARGVAPRVHRLLMRPQSRRPSPRVRFGRPRHARGPAARVRMRRHRPHVVAPQSEKRADGCAARPPHRPPVRASSCAAALLRCVAAVIR